MPRPDTEGRYEILRLQLTSKSVAPDVDLLQLARDLPGLVGADLANIVNEAQLNGEGVNWRGGGAAFEGEGAVCMLCKGGMGQVARHLGTCRGLLGPTWLTLSMRHS